MKHRLILCLGWLFCCLSWHLHAQSPASIQFATTLDAQTYEETRVLLRNYQALFQTETPNSFDTHPIHQLLEYSFVQTDTLASQYLSYKSALERKETGLNFKASFTSQTVQDLQEGEVPLATGPLARVGVEWDMLQSGLLNHSLRQRVAETEWQIFELTRERTAQADNYAFQYNYIIQQFNQAKIKRLQHRTDFLKVALAILEKLYLNHQLTYSDVLDYRRKLEESQVLTAAYQKYNNSPLFIGKKNLPVFDATTIPVVRLQLEPILQETIQRQDIETLRRLQKEKIDLQNQPALDWKLKTRLNYNVQFNGMQPQGGFPSLGISFGMPIRFNKKEREALINVEKAQVDQEAENLLYNNKKELLNLYQEYNYKLKQYIHFLHQQEDINEQIRIKRATLEHQSQPQSPLPLLKAYDNHIATGIELIDLKQQLYLLLLKMYSLNPKMDLTAALQPISVEHIEQKLAGKRMLLFVESDISRFGTATYYTEYLRKNEMETILITADIDPSWISFFQSRGFDVWTSEERALNHSGTKGTYQFKDHAIVFSAHQQLRPQKSAYEIVKIDQFQSRYTLEEWIHNQNKQLGTSHFLFIGATHLHDLEAQGFSLKTANNY
jgi:hypothetical protein